VQGEHLTVEIFSNCYFVASLSVGNGEAVCDFDLRKVQE